MYPASRAVVFAVLTLAVGCPVWAADATDARAVIDRAIEAAGGRQKLAPFRIQTWTEKGTYYGMGGDGLPYTGKYAMQWPDKFRMEIEGVFTSVVNGDQGWVIVGGQVQPISKEQLASSQDNLYGGWVTTLLPLDDKAYTLTLLPESKVDDRPVTGVRVSRQGRGDVNLYFDKATGLLARSEMQVRTEESKDKPVLQETTYGDYREVAGARIPTKITMKRDGKRFVEAVNENVKPVEKLDDKVFAKPGE